MERFEMLVLGCGSAKPTDRHFPSAQILNIHDKLYMIDCGEGAQIQMCHNHVSFSRLSNIFISHLHGDHCFGLIGLISTYNLLGRTADLNVYAPQGIGDIINTLCGEFCKEMSYKVNIHTIDTRVSQKIFEDRTVEVFTIPLNHRIPCCGFLVCEKQKLPHIRRDMIDFYNIPTYALKSIKEGMSWETPDGETIPSERLTTPAEKARKFAYCSDTTFLPPLKEILHGVDLLYHEATFGEDNASRAKDTFHSTARQAATIAKEAEVKQLVIGHFSSRYNSTEDEGELLRQAQEIFPNTSLANENKKFVI